MHIVAASFTYNLVEGILVVVGGAFLVGVATAAMKFWDGRHDALKARKSKNETTLDRMQRYLEGEDATPYHDRVPGLVEEFRETKRTVARIDDTMVTKSDLQAAVTELTAEITKNGTHP